jgi:hypothetical protein
MRCAPVPWPVMDSLISARRQAARTSNPKGHLGKEAGGRETVRGEREGVP